MRLLWIMFGWNGRIGRLPFATGLAAIVALFVLGVRSSQMRWPWLDAAIEANGFIAPKVRNQILSFLAIVLAWSLMALGAKRLRDRGRSPWWIVVVVVPVLGLLLINNNIDLIAYGLFPPAPVQWALLLDSSLFGIWVLFEGLLLPGHDGPQALQPAKDAKPATITDKEPPEAKPAEPQRKGLAARLSAVPKLPRIPSRRRRERGGE